MKEIYSFKTKRLSARSIIENDAKLLVKWRSDSAINRYFLNPHAITIDEHIKWFENYLKDESRVDFLLHYDAVAIGSLSLSQIDFSQNSCEIGYLIGEQEFQGKGYALEGVSSLMKFGNSNFKLTKFIAKVHKENLSSQKLCENCGFTLSISDQDFLEYCKQWTV